MDSLYEEMNEHFLSAAPYQSYSLQLLEDPTEDVRCTSNSLNWTKSHTLDIAFTSPHY